MKCTIWIVKLMRISNDDDDEMDKMTEWCGASARFLMLRKICEKGLIVGVDIVFNFYNWKES